MLEDLTEFGIYNYNLQSSCDHLSRLRALNHKLGCAMFRSQTKHLAWLRTLCLAILFDPPNSPRGNSSQHDSCDGSGLAIWHAQLTKTPLKWSQTAELSPPRSASPQVTTDSPARMAAKAIQLPESQQRRRQWLESAAHPWADLEPPNCHRHGLHHPKWRRIHLLEWQQNSKICAARPWADLELPNCHSHGLHHPKWRPIHLLEWQQNSKICGLNPAARPWADIELPNCHSHNYSARPQVTIALSPWPHKAEARPVAASSGSSTRACPSKPEKALHSRLLYSSIYPLAKSQKSCVGWCCPWIWARGFP